MVSPGGLAKCLNVKNLTPESEDKKQEIGFELQLDQSTILKDKHSECTTARWSLHLISTINGFSFRVFNTKRSI